MYKGDLGEVLKGKLRFSWRPRYVKFLKDLNIPRHINYTYNYKLFANTFHYLLIHFFNMTRVSVVSFLESRLICIKSHWSFSFLWKANFIVVDSELCKVVFLPSISIQWFCLMYGNNFPALLRDDLNATSIDVYHLFYVSECHLDSRCPICYWSIGCNKALFILWCAFTW